MSLADMFNSPPSAPPPRSPRATTPTTPSRGGAQPLFFSPGSAGGTPARPAAGPSTTRPRPSVSVPADDFDFPFDDEDEALPAVPAPLAAPAVRQDNGMFRGLTQAGGDFAPLVDPFAGVRTAGADGDGEGGKKRRVMAKVDADRLMEANGLPALMQKAKRFKVRGKGRETEDLAELMSIYQLWAHKMFPKGDFAGTIQRVEVMCRGRRMNSALKGYREAFYPPRKSPTPPARSPSPIRSEADEAEDPTGDRPVHVDGRSDRGGSVPVSHRPSNRPPRRLPQEQEEEGDDAEAEAAMEEMLRQEQRAARTTSAGDEDDGGRNREDSGRPEPLFTPGEPDEEELAALLEMEDDL